MFIFEKAPFSMCHASTLVEVTPGKFLAAWYGGTAEGNRDVAIWASHTDGPGWSEPLKIADQPGSPCWDPVLFTAGKELVLYYKVGPSPQTWSAVQKRSDDGGKKWSDAVVLPAGVIGPTKNKPIRLADGALLAGTSVENFRYWTAWADRSTDDAKTWTRYGPIDVPEKPFHLIQPTLLEVEPKRIVALCRSRTIGFICQAESLDGGRTWSAAKPLDARMRELPNPNSGIDAVRTEQGECFLVYNHTPAGRFPLNLAFSGDQAKTWKKVATLEDQLGEFSAPAIIQGSDGKLHVTYTWNRRHIKYLVLDPTRLRG